MNQELNAAFNGGRDPLHFETAQQVYACMETGNAGQAAVILEEYRALHPDKAEALRVSLIRDYGQGL